MRRPGSDTSIDGIPLYVQPLAAAMWMGVRKRRAIDGTTVLGAGTWVVICRQCDRGNRYCKEGCAKSARRASSQAAGKRYRATPAGRLGGARRQREYRRRERRAIVTHHGSPEEAPGVTGRLRGVVMGTASDTKPQEDRHDIPPNPIVTFDGAPTLEAPRCTICGRDAGRFTRFDFLPAREHRRRKHRRLPRDWPR